MEQKKKMAVFDLDGTLLNNDRAISGKNAAALVELNENGYEVVLASGRPEILMRVYYLGFSFVRYVISSNGGIIRDVQADKIVYRRPIHPEAVRKIIAICDRTGAECDLYSHDGMSRICTDEIDLELTDEIVFNFKKHILKDRKLSEFPCEKMFVTQKDALKLKALREKIAAEVPKVEITQSSFQALDIMDRGVNKGMAVKWLAEALGIDRQAVAAFGDHLNDLEMLEYAGTSIVCSNAVEAVRQAAVYVLPESNHQSGIAAGIRRYLLVQQSAEGQA